MGNAPFLHKQDDWELIPYARMGTSSASWIWHHCGGTDGCGTPRWCVASCKTGVCYNCDARIPDEILGLWRLHNWDNI